MGHNNRRISHSFPFNRSVVGILRTIGGYAKLRHVFTLLV
jgi:hypothetical protein